MYLSALLSHCNSDGELSNCEMSTVHINVIHFESKHVNIESPQTCGNQHQMISDTDWDSVQDTNCTVIPSEAHLPESSESILCSSFPLSEHTPACLCPSSPQSNVG